jgi:hypothetical protein
MSSFLRVLLGAAIGFGAGWLAFTSPFGSTDDAAKLERRALQAYGIHGRKANCTRREYPANVWDCAVQSDDQLAYWLSARATVHRDGSVSFSGFKP